jgi:hypothetical protein
MFSVRHILNTEEGSSFVESLDSEKPLSTDEKGELSNLICGYFLDRNMKLTRDDLVVLGKEIVDIFPHENLISYITADKSKGQLYYKYNNLKHKKKVLAKSKLQKSKSVPTSTVVATQPLDFSQRNIDSDNYVRANPQGIGNIFELHWRDSAKFRKYSMSKINSENPLQECLERYETFRRQDGWIFVSSLNSTHSN